MELPFTRQGFDWLANKTFLRHYAAFGDLPDEQLLQSLRSQAMGAQSLNEAVVRRLSNIFKADAPEAERRAVMEYMTTPMASVNDIMVAGVTHARWVALLKETGDLPSSAAGNAPTPAIKYTRSGFKSQGIEFPTLAGILPIPALSKPRSAAAEKYQTLRNKYPKEMEQYVLRHHAIAAKMLISSIARRLEKLGLLDPEVRLANNGRYWEEQSYLPRMYLAYLLNDGSNATTSRHGSRMNVANLEKRKDLEPWVRDMLLGEIDDQPGFLMAMSIGTSLRNIAIMDYMEMISKNNEWVAAESMVDYDWNDIAARAARAGSTTVITKPGSVISPSRNRKRKVSPWWLAARADALIEMAERAYTGNRKKEVLIIARVMQDIANAGIQNATIAVRHSNAMPQSAQTATGLKNRALRLLMNQNVPQGQSGRTPADFKFRQMPDTAQYGVLRGAWVREEIYYDLVGAMQLSMDIPHWSQELLGTKAFQKYHSFWKLQKVAANPTSVFRNIWSNSIIMHLSGMPLAPPTVTGPYWKLRGKGKPTWQHHAIVAPWLTLIYDFPGKRADGTWDKGSYAYRQYIAHGGNAQAFANQELYHLHREVTGLYKTLNAGKGTLAEANAFARGALEAYVRNVGNIYQGTEAMAKIAKMKFEMEVNDLTPGEAFAEATKWLFDYSETPPVVDTLRRQPFTGPAFLTYYYKVVPRLFEVAITAPHRFTPYVALMESMWFAATGLLAGLGDDDREAVMAALPEFLRKSGVLPMPVKIGTEIYLWDASYIFPWTMPWHTLRAMSNMDWDKLVAETGVGSTGMNDLIAVLFFNRENFRGKEVRQDAGTAWEQTMDMFWAVWSSFMPQWMADRIHGGTLSKTIDAMVGHENDFGNQPEPMAFALSRWFGLTFYEFDTERGFDMAMKRAADDLSDWYVSRRLAEMNSKTMSEERKKARKKADDKRLKEKMAEIKETRDAGRDAFSRLQDRMRQAN